MTGRFEIFANDVWTELPANGVFYAPRNGVHCFRDRGDTDGTIQFVCGGNHFDTFLEGLSAYHLPQDVQAVLDHSAKYGIYYPTLPPPTQADIAVRDARAKLVAS